MSWARDGSDLVTWFTGREQLSELWRNHMHAIKCIATCKPSLAQLNLDSPQHALSNGYRVWGVKVTLGYEGKRSRVTRTSDRGGPAHGDRCLSWARSPHHLLRFCLPSQILAVCEGKLTKFSSRGSAPHPAGALPQTPLGLRPRPRLGLTPQTPSSHFASWV